MQNFSTSKISTSSVLLHFSNMLFQPLLPRLWFDFPTVFIPRAAFLSPHPPTHLLVLHSLGLTSVGWPPYQQQSCQFPNWVLRAGFLSHAPRKIQPWRPPAVLFLCVCTQVAKEFWGRASNGASLLIVQDQPSPMGPQVCPTTLLNFEGHLADLPSSASSNLLLSFLPSTPAGPPQSQ